MGSGILDVALVILCCFPSCKGDETEVGHLSFYHFC